MTERRRRTMQEPAVHEHEHEHPHAEENGVAPPHAPIPPSFGPRLERSLAYANGAIAVFNATLDARNRALQEWELVRQMCAEAAGLVVPRGHIAQVDLERGIVAVLPPEAAQNGRAQ
jgi:hypothetical protein